MTKICLFCLATFTGKYPPQKFCSRQCANRHNLNNLRKANLPEKSEKLAEFVGMYLGDGTLATYYACIFLNTIADKEYVFYVKDLCQKLFPGISVTLVKKSIENCVRVQINSVLVARFLQRMGLKPKSVPEWIFEKESYQKACIRGLFDTEGSISYKIYKARKKISVYKQLNFRNADVNLMKFVRDGLVNYGFSPTMTLRRSLYLSTHKDIELYRQMIGFSNPKLIKRSMVQNWEEYLIWKGEKDRHAMRNDNGGFA